MKPAVSTSTRRFQNSPTGPEHKLALAAAAERAGFHGFFMAEHQGTPLSVDGSPAVVLSALFQRTRRLRINYLLCVFSFSDIAPEHAIRSPELFASEVTPKLKA